MEAIWQQLAQLQQQQQGQQPQGALPTAKSGMERQSKQQQLTVGGFDNIQTFSVGEGEWQTWSWKIKRAVIGLGREETVDCSGDGWSQRRRGDPGKTTSLLGGMCRMLAKHTNSEVSTIVRTVTESDGVEAWRKLH